LGTLLQNAGISPRHPGVPWIGHDLLGIEVEELPKFTDTILNAPVVAACLSILLPKQSIVGRRSVIDLQGLRSFDAEWFDEAHALASAILMARGLDQEAWD